MTTKLCLLCGMNKANGDWAKCAGTKDGLQSKCKECQKAYRAANKEKHLTYASIYRESNRDKASDTSRQWRKDNPNYSVPKEKVAAKAAKRRSYKLKATPPWLDDTHYRRIESIYKASQRTTERTGVQHHVDHVVPLKGRNVCGLHVWWNLRIVPADQNLKKGNTYEEY